MRKKIAYSLICSLLVSAFASANVMGQSTSENVAKEYILQDDKPANTTIKAWENDSYPLGNGYFGVSFFGGVQKELWQVTEPSVFVYYYKEKKKSHRIKLTSAIELWLETDHNSKQVTDYTRQLDINRGIGLTTYKSGGVTYTREQLTSYPNNCFAARLTADQGGKISFRLNAKHSYADYYRTIETRVDGDQIVLTGSTEPINVTYQARITVDIKGGKMTTSAVNGEGLIEVSGADIATIYLTIGTNYRLEPKTFLIAPGFSISSDSTGMPPEFAPKADKLKGNPLPVKDIKDRLTKAQSTGWNTLRKRHVEDVFQYMKRCKLDLGGVKPTTPTRELLRGENRPEVAKRYLEELYFQFGRYLMVSSSRPGTLPAGLQGIWNWNKVAPWTGGFWYNINFQMNYWPVFNTNLAEFIGPYMDLLKASFPRNQQIAKEYAKEWGGKDIDDVWTVGTGNSPYDNGSPGSSGGVGSGPFLLYAIWDAYQFTGDEEILKDLWPFLLSSSRFLESVMKEAPDGNILCNPSWSPELRLDKGNETFGTAYDQQLVYESHKMTLAAAKILGKQDPILDILKDHIKRLDPVIIGDSGQIKEYREETTYASLGGKDHRHISQLIGLVPGTVITQKPEWIEAARKTLNFRGDESTGWALAHRFNAWTRVYDGERSFSLLNCLLADKTFDNLWCKHPPFQIDGNFGGTAGIAEMVLQSHRKNETGFIMHLLPAIPGAWKEGSVSGMRARGGFEVDIQWTGGKLRQVSVKSLNGNACTLQYGDRLIKVVTEPGKTYCFDGTMKLILAK